MINYLKIKLIDKNKIIIDIHKNKILEKYIENMP